MKGEVAAHDEQKIRNFNLGVADYFYRSDRRIIRQRGRLDGSAGGGEHEESGGNEKSQFFHVRKPLFFRIFMILSFLQLLSGCYPLQR